MKPNPRVSAPVADTSSLTGPRIPKAVEVDPAAPATLASVSSNTSDTSVASNAGNARKDGVSGVIPGEITKITIRVPADIAGRARTAWRISLAGNDACPSFSAWVARAIEKAVIDAEQQLTGGKPLDVTGPGLIPTGGAVHDRN